MRPAFYRRDDERRYREHLDVFRAERAAYALDGVLDAVYLAAVF